MNARRDSAAVEDEVACHCEPETDAPSAEIGLQDVQIPRPLICVEAPRHPSLVFGKRRYRAKIDVVDVLRKNREHHHRQNSIK